MSYRSLLFCLVLPLSGCFIYFGDDKDDDHGDDEWSDDSPSDDVWFPDAGYPPVDAACVVVPQPVVELRDPYTGICLRLGGGPPACEASLPPYGLCESQCSSLDEADCLGTGGCRAIYTGDEANRFAACWSTGTNGPWDGPCEVLDDAQACSTRDDCSAWYGGGAAPDGFLACFAESSPTPASCEGLDESTCIDYEDGCAGDAECAVLFCEPLYAGVGCDCTPAGCTCDSWAYQACRDATP